MCVSIPGRMKRLLSLLQINFSISAFTFGGGYVVIPMMEKQYVEKHKWITHEELLDMAAVAQSAPGAIAVNLAVLAGYRIAGAAGAAVSCIAALLPPLILLSVISLCYRQFQENRIILSLLKGMEAGVAAMIADLLLDMAASVRKEKNVLLTLMMPAAFLSCFLFRIDAVTVILACAGICLAYGLLAPRQSKRT